jgi:hypothetical protein
MEGVKSEKEEYADNHRLKIFPEVGRGEKITVVIVLVFGRGIL